MAASNKINTVRVPLTSYARGGSAKKLEAFWENLRKYILETIHETSTKTQTDTPDL